VKCARRTPRLALVAALIAGCGPEVFDDLDVLDGADAERAISAKGRTWPVLRRGRQGRDVVSAQYMLRHHGETLALDGAFGWGTNGAVRSHQKKKALSVDGVVGGNTWESLVVTVRRGDSGWAVGALQDQLLRRYGYGIGVTKQFGPTTESRVKAFQKAHCIVQNGVVGPMTWHALVANHDYCTGSSIPDDSGSGSCSSFINPAPGFVVTSEFGACRDGCSRRHEGIDLGTPTGTPVRAAMGGKVVWAGWMSGYGYTIDVSHCGKFTTRYAHLSSFFAKQGQTVGKGQFVAKSGNTGVGTGPHLHFEIRKGGRWGTAVNPRHYIKF
jgi:peptidoglycan hydrolase-like protein with peptidoglycan-binding domain